MAVAGDPLIGLASAARSGSEASGRALPPVHLWNPPHCGEIDIRIRRDGGWWHEGSPIGRPALVRLFSTVLRRDPDGYYLVTPVEKLKIVVEDVPFVAVSVDRLGEALSFVTNVGDVTEAGPDNPLRIETDAATGAPTPYVHVRRGLEARLTRPVFYALVELAQPRAAADGEYLAVASNGAWFDLGSTEAGA
jgi:hypothetical protein